MKHASTQTLSAFYQRLGYLFYSVAAADRQVRREEIDMLHRMVLEDWLDLEGSKDAYGTDAAYQIEITFDLIQDREISADKAFRVFEEWYHEHAELFDSDVIHRINHTAARIAASFHGTGKVELAMIYRIKALLGTGHPSL